MLVTEIGECVITLILFPLLYYAYIYIFFIKGVSDSGKGLLSEMFCLSVNISSCSTATVCPLKKNPVLKHSPGSVNSMLLDMVGPLCLQSLGCVVILDITEEVLHFLCLPVVIKLGKVIIIKQKNDINHLFIDVMLQTGSN